MLPRTTKMADDFGWGRERFVHRGPHAGEPSSRAGDRAGLRFPRGQRLGLPRHGAAARRDARGAREALRRAAPAARGGGARAPALDVLAAAHAKGAVHRDIKPANILLDDAGPSDPDRFRRLAGGDGGPQRGAHRDLHAGLRCGRADDLGQAGPVDRHLRPVGHALSRHHRSAATRCFRPPPVRRLRAAGKAGASRASHRACAPASMQVSPSSRATGRRLSPAGGYCSAPCRRRPPMPPW